jgi:GT2 family glycosyltransferase
MKPQVVTIIVTWNSAKDIQDCLQSLRKQDYADHKIVVVDNNSTDNTVELIKQNFPEVILIQTGKNLYFAGGNNFGIDYALQNLNPEFIAVLNPDTLVQPNWLSTQVEIMLQDAKIGVVGPKVVFAPGFGPSPTEKSSATQIYINTAGILPGGFLFPYDRGYGEIDQGQYNQMAEVYALSGVSMLVRSEVLKQTKGFFAPMQMYLEDVDLCLTAKQKGWKVIYTPTTTVMHKHMQSTHQAGGNRYTFWSKRNYLLLVSRHYSFKKFLRAVREVGKSTDFVTFVKICLDYLRIQTKL